MTENEYREFLEKRRKKIPLHKLMTEVNNYDHDYGTVVIGIHQVMMKTFDDMNQKQGITGFQASCLMWEFIKEFSSMEVGKLVNFSDLLFPQYKDKFEKTITPDTWEWIKEQAKEKLESRERVIAHAEVVAHWKSIAAGNVPFGFKVVED